MSTFRFHGLRSEKQLTIKATQIKDLEPAQLATAMANAHPLINELTLQQLGGDLVCLRGPNRVVHSTRVQVPDTVIRGT